jgi:AbrB family looped-hinge helix DNA binding protein
MSSVATTKMSSKGQVVIPEEIREELGLEAGTKFVVLGGKDSVMLKVITPPDKVQFNKLLKEARALAKKEGLKKSDLEKAIKEVRAKKK